VVQSPNLALHWYALRRAIRSRRETALASAKETG
jgi:hypothetical protein